MKKLICGVAMALGLAGCGGVGSEYVGQWVMVADDCSTMEIAKDGDGFVVKVDPTGIPGKKIISVPASLNDGKLKAGPNTLVLDKKTGNILVAKDVYKRLTGKKRVCKFEKAVIMSADQVAKLYSPSSMSGQ